MDFQLYFYQLVFSTVLVARRRNKQLGRTEINLKARVQFVDWSTFEVLFFALAELMGWILELFFFYMKRKNTF